MVAMMPWRSGRRPCAACPRPRVACPLTWRADAAPPAEVSVPSGPYRSLRRLPAEAWLDAAGLARRISVNSEPAAAADAQAWSIVELWDFGVAASITRPIPVKSWRRGSRWRCRWRPA